MIFSAVREREREDIFHSLIHNPNVCMVETWLRQALAAKNSVQVSRVVSGAQLDAVSLLSPRVHMNRKLESDTESTLNSSTPVWNLGITHTSL